MRVITKVKAELAGSVSKVIGCGIGGRYSFPGICSFLISTHSLGQGSSTIQTLRAALKISTKPAWPLSYTAVFRIVRCLPHSQGTLYI
jgi:hypothetical protein